MCNFSGLAEIAKSIFGSGESSNTPPSPEGVMPSTGDMDRDVANIKAMLRMG